MAYFLKQSKLKKGTYLQIYESFYNPEKKGTSHKSYKALGYVHDLIASGIEDPISHFREEVCKLNAQRQRENEKQIDISPLRYLGYFPLKSILSSLHVSGYLDLMQSVRNFKFSLNDLMQALIFSRCVNPCSKYKTFHDVMPLLVDRFDGISYDQMLEGLEFMGQEYEKIVEIFTAKISQLFGLDSSTTYFDCTNFYFEIDREDDFRKRGPSKENRYDPIIGLGLLLDANQIPIAMKMYPGNESEKPLLRTIISGMKSQNNITGRTIQVADKGLNCADNIIAALKNGDGYLFSKSVKMLPELERTWVLLDQDYQDVRDKDGKLLYRYKSCIDDFPYEVTAENGKKRKIKLREKRLVTFNPSLAKKKRIEISRMVEKAENLRLSKAKKSEYGECGKYVLFKSTDKSGKATEEKVISTLNEAAIQKDLSLAGYNLLVTSELQMEDSMIYQTYHNLWRIEESFRIMKSDLDARPAFVQKENCIKGHFLICYLTELLERILQFKVLDCKYSSGAIYKFMKDFKVVQADSKTYINITSTNDFIKSLSKEFSLPLTSYFLSAAQIKEVLNFSI